MVDMLVFLKNDYTEEEINATFKEIVPYFNDVFDSTPSLFRVVRDITFEGNKENQLPVCIPQGSYFLCVCLNIGDREELTNALKEANIRFEAVVIPWGKDTLCLLDYEEIDSGDVIFYSAYYIACFDKEITITTYQKLESEFKNRNEDFRPLAGMYRAIEQIHLDSGIVIEEGQIVVGLEVNMVNTAKMAELGFDEITNAIQNDERAANMLKDCEIGYLTMVELTNTLRNKFEHIRDNY